MLSILKKEFKTYFVTPTGYIFISIFLLILGITFFRFTFLRGSTQLEYVVQDSAVILTFLTPVLTMRMFAEERKNGTDLLLNTSPKSIVSIVLGKFLAATLVIVVTQSFYLVYYLILRHFGPVSLIEPFVGMLGFILLSMCYIAFGMFISSLTSNLVFAAIIPMAFNFGILFLYSGIPILSLVSLMAMYQKFPLGIISLKELVGFISFIILFVLLTILVLQRRKSVK